jgi:hypothetical protein
VKGDYHCHFHIRFVMRIIFYLDKENTVVIPLNLKVENESTVLSRRERACAKKSEEIVRNHEKNQALCKH